MRNTQTVGLALGGLLMCGAWATADPWNARTTLTFSQPVKVPGATLEAGTYEFSLVNPAAGRHIVQIATGSRVVAVIQAVPTKRAEAMAGVTLTFSATTPGDPPALKAWFYPGSVYGHELVYSEEEARVIAERSKTLVLSIDVPGTDVHQGTLRLYDASGAGKAWTGDDATMREWETWRRGQSTASTAAGQSTSAPAPLVQDAPDGLRVTLDELEDDPRKYVGQTISVDAEVEDVLGPRAFTIDEPNWIDLDGEVLVYVPATLAALVREHDRVTVTGTMQAFLRADMEGEWGWERMDPVREQRLAARPVLVASRIVGGSNKATLVLDINSTVSAASRPSSTASSSAVSPLTDVRTVVVGDRSLVGRRVGLGSVTIDAVADKGGFFVQFEGERLFVLPAPRNQPTFTVGDRVAIDGVLLQMPRDIDERLNLPGSTNDDVYVYALRVSRL